MMLTNIHAVEIRFVRPAEMRYATVGDWQFHGETLTITVADPIGAPVTSVLLVAIHELVEAILCDAHGVSGETVDQWDEHWDETTSAYDESGADPAAPYHREHLDAELVERLVANMLGIPWVQHDGVVDKMMDAVVDALTQKKERP